MPAIRILVADPVELIADGLRARWAEMDDLLIVGHVASGGDLLERVKELEPEVVVMEVSLPGMDGIDCTRRMHHAFPAVKVLAHSSLTAIEYVNSMRIEGASGYVVKGCPAEEIAEAVRVIVTGGEYLGAAVRESIEGGYQFTRKRMDGEYIGLTEREREIIRMIAMERTNDEIAAALFVSTDTVKTHRKNLMTKLNVRNAAGLVKYAVDRRWI